MVDFRDSLVARRISLLLIVSFLLEITAPAFAKPFWEEKPAYPQARRKHHRSHPSDPHLSSLLKKTQGPAANLPEFHGESPLDGIDDGEGNPGGSSAPVQAKEDRHDEPEDTHTEPVDPPGPPAETGPELGYVDADPTQPFPQWEYSRQTYAKGPYLRTGQEVPSVQVQDQLLHIARKLDNPGESEEYTLDVVSPINENNGTSRGSVASCRWNYRRLSGSTASSFDAKYELTIRVWDRHNPDQGRVVFRKKEAMWLSQIPLHAAFGLKDIGQHRLITTRNEEPSTTQVIQVNYPTPDDDGFSRRLANQDRPAVDSPLISFTSDERFSDRRTLQVPAPDENGRQDFTARIDWSKSGFAKTTFHTYASAQIHYTSDGNDYRVERRLYDSLFREGHTISVETGSGRLDYVTLAAGVALPKSGSWQIRERADGQPVQNYSVQVRSVETEVGPLTSSLFNDGSVYRMAVKSGTNWVPEDFRWILTLRNTATGQPIRTYQDEVSGNDQPERQFFQTWDGKDDQGVVVPTNTSIAPELSIIVLNEPSPAPILGASRVALAACNCGEPEEWVLTGANGAFGIDDDLQLFLNGKSILNDTDGVTTYFDAIPFQAKVGDLLEVQAKDTFGICSTVEPIYITRTSTGTKLRLTRGYTGPCDDSAKGLIFFDETYVLSDDEKTVVAIFNSNGADLANETRNACEALAWTRTASVPPPPSAKSKSPQPPPPYSSSAGSNAIGAINHVFDIPGQYTAANFPGISSIGGDIDALFYNFINHPGQMGFSSAIPILISKSSGRFSHAFTDLVVYSRTAPLYLGRSYASNQQAQAGNFGWNWSFDEKMIVFQNQVIYQLPDGNAVVYQDDGDGYKPIMEHLTTTLTKLDDRHFQFDYKGGGSSLYEIPSGLTPNPEIPVLAVLHKSTDSNGIFNTFHWDSTGQRLLRMQGPDPSQYINLQWTNECTAKPRLLSACDSAGRQVVYSYCRFDSPRGEQDELLSKVTLTGQRSISFRYHPVLGQREYDLLDVLHNDVIQEKVVSNPRSQGQLKEVTHRPDKTMTFTRQVDPDSGEVSTTFSTQSASNDSPGGLPQSLRYKIDDDDRVVGVTDDLGNQIFYEWDEHDNLRRAYDLQGHDVHMTFDPRRNLTSVTDQAGRVNRQVWDDQDNLVASIDNLNRTSTMTWDTHHHPLTASDSLHHTATMTYSATGLPISVSNANQNQTTMEYDSKGFLSAIQLPAASGHGPARTSVVRNSNGEVLRGIDPLGRVVKAERNAIGWVTAAITPAVSAHFRQQALPAARSEATYNRNDLQESVRSVDGRVTTYRYDLAERLIEVQETGYPAPTRLAYDAFDNLKSITRPNGATTVYTRDRLNRVTEVQYPGGDTEQLVYNARGHVAEWHRGSLVVIYTYDSVDRLANMSCPSTGDNYTYTIDTVDRLTALQDQTGTTTYDYTGNDMLEKITRPGNKVISYRFDQGDRLVRTTDPENLVTDYSYNERNQLTSARHDGQVVAYRYDLLGRATNIDYPNGVRGQQEFDERDRLLYRNYQKSGTPLLTLKYAYNQLGQRILDDRAMPTGNQLARFTYNQRLELTKSVRERGCNSETHTYGYDLNHNRTQADGVNYANNLADQLQTVDSGGSLSYNGAGQADSAQGWDLTYNCSDQITGIQMPGKSISYLYDGSGQRVQKTVNGVTSKYLWSGGDIAKEYAGDGSVKADYFLGAGREGIKTGGQWYYYLSDIQGSTLMLTDSSGHSAATYDYSDYGETRQTSGSTALYNPFLYTGQEYDFETSLYHLRARHYSPTLGRFFARDPIGSAGGPNMYAYCGGDPIGCTDPSGLSGSLFGQKGNVKFSYTVSKDDSFIGSMKTDSRGRSFYSGILSISGTWLNGECGAMGLGGVSASYSMSVTAFFLDEMGIEHGLITLDQYGVPVTVNGSPGAAIGDYQFSITGVTSDQTEFNVFFVKVQISGTGTINYALSSKPFTHFFTYAARIQMTNDAAGKTLFQVGPWNGVSPGRLFNP